MSAAFFRALLLVASLLASAGTVAQQGYPSRPIRFVVHTTAGASSDVTARATADEMGKRLGQQFVVENRAGAGGLIGAEVVARVALDVVSQGSRSLLRIDAEGRVLGKLGGLAQGVIQRKAEEIIDEFGARLRQAVQDGAC